MMHIEIIHRADRPERVDVLQREFMLQDINGHIFSAIVGDLGWEGCRDSHLAVMKKCKSLKTFAIFEDDVKFLHPFSSLDIIMKQLPKEWDCLYLGGNPQKPQERYSLNLFRCTDTLCTHAIIWHNRKGGVINYILDHKDEIKKIDVFFRNEIQTNFNCFLTDPLICTQWQYQSDTCRRSNVGAIAYNYSRYCI